MRSTTRVERKTSVQFRLALMARRVAADCSGASAREYAVLTLVIIAIAAVVFQIGGSVTAMYERVEGLFTN